MDHGLEKLHLELGDVLPDGLPCPRSKGLLTLPHYQAVAEEAKSRGVIEPCKLQRVLGSEKASLRLTGAHVLQRGDHKHTRQHQLMKHELVNLCCTSP